MKKYSSADAYRIDEYDAQLAMSPVKGNPFEAENFYPADGFFAEAAGCPTGYTMNYFGHCIKTKKSSGSAMNGNYSEAAGCPTGYSMNYFGSCIKNKRTGASSAMDGVDIDEEMSDARGFFSRRDREKRRQQREGRRSKRQERFKAGQESRAEARRLRSQAKLEAAKGQRAAGESLGRESQSDIELAKSIGAGAPAGATPDKGMSTTTKVLIGVGVLAVLGIGAYFVMKKK